ncbi:triose-phosphate isomerase [Thauera butanivorans]|uniref:triose-phosphate isomerase n=1 Tax=Thauera butanivorans TaxID=86174 RepID=UPI003AB7C747
MIKKLVAGNWKMNGSLAANEALLAALQPVPGVDVALCVPYPYLAQLQRRPSGFELGAQDVSEFAAGAYTGEVSAAMLTDFGCRYVIVGHSERRALFGEDDLTVARKASSALSAGLVPIVCVGETLDEREAGEVTAVITRQLAAVADLLGQEGLSRLVLAYEPVWAIGSGRSATAEQAEEAHAAMRGWLAGQGVDAGVIRILYGGSVKPDNAAELFAMPNVDGGLIGGASLVADDFMAICRAAGA